MTAPARSFRRRTDIRIGSVTISARWIPVGAYMGAIYLASAQSDISLPALLSDKFLHAMAYAVLSALIIWAWVDGRWRRITFRHVIGATVASFLYGWTDEFHQMFVANRYYDPLDMAADATGAFGAALVLWAWSIISRGNRQANGA